MASSFQSPMLFATKSSHWRLGTFHDQDERLRVQHKLTKHSSFPRRVHGMLGGNTKDECLVTSSLKHEKRARRRALTMTRRTAHWRPAVRALTGNGRTIRVARHM